MSINEHRGRRAAAKVFDLLFIRSEELVDVGSGSRRLICCIPYTLEEEVHPCGPTLILACSIEPVVIQAPVLFEEQAEIKDRGVRPVKRMTSSIAGAAVPNGLMDT